MKIITGFLAYSILGPEHALKTFADVRGDELVISGGPTPLLSGNEFQKFCNGISGAFGNLTDVRQIVFSGESIDDMTEHPAWQIGDRGQSYQPEITNFSVDENCVPADQEGKVPDANDLHYSESKYRSASNSREVFAFRIWRELGLKGNPEFSFSPDPPGGSLVYQETVSDIIEHMEPPSCNYSAEVLSKYIVHHENDVKGSWDLWPEVAESNLKSIVSDTSGISIRDGSGLSRENYVTTSFMSDLMGGISRSKYSDFLNYLPTIGIGTLANRLQNLKNKGIRAKTGSLSGVSSLSGYIGDLNVSFSVIVNNFTNSNTEPAKLVDECVNQFVEHGEITVT